jgi:hypothetical protein
VCLLYKVFLTEPLPICSLFRNQDPFVHLKQHFLSELPLLTASQDHSYCQSQMFLYP